MADAAVADAGHAKPHHDYHLVDPSPWPAVGAVLGFHPRDRGIIFMKTRLAGDANPWILLIGAAGRALHMFAWWTDVVHEAQEGDHTPVVRMHHRYGMLLFIASEIMFFVAWFWAYFDNFFRHATRSSRRVSPSRAAGRRTASSCSIRSTCRSSTRCCC